MGANALSDAKSEHVMRSKAIGTKDDGSDVVAVGLGTSSNIRIAVPVGSGASAESNATVLGPANLSLYRQHVYRFKRV